MGGHRASTKMWMKIIWNKKNPIYGPIRRYIKYHYIGFFTLIPRSRRALGPEEGINVGSNPIYLWYFLRDQGP